MTAPEGLPPLPNLPAQVAVGETRVTLEPLDQLIATASANAAAAGQAGALATRVLQQAETRLGEAGAILMTRRAGWDSAALGPQLAAAEAATRLVADLEQQAAELAARAHPGLTGFIHAIGDKHHAQELEAGRATAVANLAAQLSALARTAPSASVPEADALRREASELAARAAELTARGREAATLGARLQEEIRSRSDSSREMGFDALYTAAWIQTYGPVAVQSPLTLKRNERALFSEAATLARMTTRSQFVGGSRGVSFPIAHTGIHYRVGSFKGHSVTTSALTDVDTGTLVLSDLRLAFIGSRRAVVVQLPKIVHVETYTDAIAVFQEGREAANFYKVARPKYAVFLLNWALGQGAALS